MSTYNQAYLAIAYVLGQVGHFLLTYNRILLNPPLTWASERMQAHHPIWWRRTIQQNLTRSGYIKA